MDHHGCRSVLKTRIPYGTLIQSCSKDIPKVNYFSIIWIGELVRNSASDTVYQMAEQHGGSDDDGKAEVVGGGDVTHGGHTLEPTVDEEADHTLWQSAVYHRRVLLFAMSSFLAGGVFGYDIVVNGATVSMPSFLIYFGAVSSTGSLYLPSTWNSLWIAMSSLMQALGSFGIGFVSDKVGRKWCCVVACLVSLGGVGMQYAADSRGLLLGGKMLNGLAIGALSATSTAWASEISPLRLRGPIQSGIVLWTTLMQALACKQSLHFSPLSQSSRSPTLD